MYKPSFEFERSPEERQDMFKSWARDDRAFFAAGACHILADLFVQLHRHEGYKMIYIKPGTGLPGNHVFASNGQWAFDHNGWTKEDELLKLTKRAYSKKYRGWTFEKIILEDSMTTLENFCKSYNHRLPWQYAYLPWERTYRYIHRFPSYPPAQG